MNFINYILSPFYWTKVIKLIENGSNIEAYELMNNIHPSSVKKNYKYFYLKSYLELALREYQNSFLSIQRGLYVLDKYKKNNLNNDEYNYLHKYAYQLQKMIHKMCDEYKDLDKISILEKEISYDINNVSRKIKDYFPISA